MIFRPRLAGVTNGLASSLLLLIISSAPAQKPPETFVGHTSGVAAVVPGSDSRTLITASFDRTIKFWDLTTGDTFRSLEAHESQVLALAISPDGRTLLSGARDGTLKTWDVFLPLPVARWNGPEAPIKPPIKASAISADGTWTVSGGADGELLVWQTEKGTLLRQLPGHTADITEIAIGPHDLVIASGDAAGIVHLHSAEDGSPLGKLSAHTGAIRGLALHPKDPLLITAGGEGLLKVWQLPLTPPQELAGHEGPMHGVAFSADAKLAVTGGEDKKVRLFDTATGQSVRQFVASSPIEAVALNPDATLVAAAGEDGVLQIWETADGSPRGSLAGHEGPVSGLAFRPDRREIASTGADGTVRLWRLPEPSTSLAGHEMPVHAVAVSQDGKLAATAAADPTIRIWDPTEGKLTRTLPGNQEDSFRAVAISQDAQQIAAGQASGAIRLWNSEDDQPLGELLGHEGPIRGLNFLPEGNRLLSTGDDGLLRLWNLPTAAPRELAGNTDSVQAVATSADGKRVYTGAADGSICLFETETGKLVWKFQGQEVAVAALALDPKNTRLAAASEEGEIRIWAIDQDKPPSAEANHRLLGHVGRVHSLAFHPEGPQIASAGADGTLRLWNVPPEAKQFSEEPWPVRAFAVSPDATKIAMAGIVKEKPIIQVREAATGKVIATLSGHDSEITAVAFSQDGNKLVSGSIDKTAKVWDLAQAPFPELAQFAGHETPVRSVAFSADGSHVFSGGDDFLIRKWTVADAMEVGTLAGHAASVTNLVLAGDHLVSGGADHTVRIWQASQGQAVRTLLQDAAVVSIAVNDDAKRIAVSDAKQTVTLWDAQNGSLLATLPTPSASPTTSLAVDPQGTLIAGGSADGVCIWNAEGQLVERLAPDLQLAGLAFGPDREILAITTDNSVHRATRAVVYSVAAHEGEATSLAFAPDGKHLYSGGDQTVRRWTAQDGQAAGSFAGAQADITALAISADGSHLAATSANQSAIVWNLKETSDGNSIQPQHHLNHPQQPQRIALSQDGSRAATCDDTGQVYLWDTTSGLLLQRLAQHTASLTSIAFLEEDAAIVTAGEDKAAIIQPITAAMVFPAGSKQPTGMALLKDPKHVAVCDDRQGVTLLALSDGEPTAQAEGADAPLACLALRGDDTQLAAGGTDGNLYLWPLTSAQPGKVEKLAVGSPIQAVAYNQDGSRVAVASADKQVRFFDTSTHQLLEQMTAEAAVPSLAFLATSPESEAILLAVGNESTIRPLGLIRSIAAHEEAATDLAFSPDGNKLISGGADQTVRIWNREDGQAFASLTGAQDTIHSVAISPDGAWIAAGSADSSAVLWKMPTAATPNAVAAETTLEHPSPVLGVDFGGDATRLATSGEDGTVRVWDLATRQELQRFEITTDPVSAVALADDNRTLLAGGAGPLGHVKTVSALRVLVTEEAQLQAAVLAADGSRIMTLGTGPAVKQWDLEGKPLEERKAPQGELTRLAIRGDGKQWAAADAEGNLHLGSFDGNEPAQTIETEGPLTDLSYSTDHALLAAVGQDNALRVFATDDGRLLQAWQATTPLHTVRFTPDSRHLITGGEDQSLQVWAYASPLPKATFTENSAAIYCLAIGPDGTWAASAGADDSILLWDLTEGKVSKRLAGHEGPVYGLAIGGDGKQLLSGGADGTVRLWDTQSGDQQHQFALPQPKSPEDEPAVSPAAVYCVAFSEAADVVVASDARGKTRIWDVASGKLTATLGQETDPTYRAIFSPTGKHLLTCGHTGRIVVWDLEKQSPQFEGLAPTVAYDATYSTDGKNLIIAGADGTAHRLAPPAK